MAEQEAAAALANLENDNQPALIGAEEDEIATSRKNKKASPKPTSSKDPSDSSKRKIMKGVPDFPVEPTIIQLIKKPRTYTNHSYRDFSKVPKEIGDKQPTKIEDMDFPQKVHDILAQPEYQNWISWLPHGRAFRVHVPKRLEQGNVLKKYFGHNRYSSFLRQLSNHGFKHITQGPDRNCYYHEMMLRGLPHLTKYMPAPKDARRLIPDPENEPNFYVISAAHPLPDDPSYRGNAKPANAGVNEARNATAAGLEMPSAKRQMLSMPGVPVIQPSMLGLAQQLPVPPQAADLQANLAKLQEVMKSNNQLLAAAALQASLSSAPVPNPTSPSTAALAALLRQNHGLNGSFLGGPL